MLYVSTLSRLQRPDCLLFRKSPGKKEISVQNNIQIQPQIAPKLKALVFKSFQNYTLLLPSRVAAWAAYTAQLRRVHVLIDHLATLFVPVLRLR
jgi:hypothetical protein